MPASPTTASANMACLHCSPARTVWHKYAQKDSQDKIEKIYVSGSMADAEHELAMGQMAAGSGVVNYHSVLTDPQAKRPAIILAFAEGQNLDALVSERGAIPAAEAVLIVASIAKTIARLHDLHCPEAVRGMCHGDIKPQNVLATGDSTLLLDFEHACTIGTARSGGFTGGTSAYSPPEANQGQQPDATFDVFGLGATLAFLLDGGITRRIPQHPEVDALVKACCAVDPAARPTAKDIAIRCKRLAIVLRDDETEQNLHDWATGLCSRPPTDRTDPRARMWTRRRRILDHLPSLLEAPKSISSDPEGLLQEVEMVARAIDRFPRNETALARRQQLFESLRQLLGSAAATVHELNKSEQFDEARRWLGTAESLVTMTMAMAGGLSNITRQEHGLTPGALQRAPIEFLQLLTEQTKSANAELQERIHNITAAEQALDLTLAEQEIDAMAADYGGTSKTVAERRDQLHRLGFYLDRIARSQAKVERIGPQWDPAALQPLQAIITAAAQALPTQTQRESGGGGAIGLRSLQITLSNVAEEFPHLLQVSPALGALSQALIHLTDQAWQQLSDAEERLRIVPVPVRPLQLALGRLDTFRMLEAFVDRPDRPRSELLDGLERLRIGLEQARSARDRLAENAETALARGHWTTGLFNMERAVERITSDDDSEQAEAERMRERLQAARRTKQDIETALRRNVELSANYTALEDDPLSTFDARTRILQERRDCLMFLGVHVPNDRAELYRKDVRSVETQIALERAANAERRLAALTDPAQRLRLVRNTVDILNSTDSSSGGKLEPSGRLVRLQDHWRTVAMRCQRTVDALHQEQLLQKKRRRRMWAIAIIALLITSTALGFAISPWLSGEPAIAAEKTH